MEKGMTSTTSMEPLQATWVKISILPNMFIQGEA